MVSGLDKDNKTLVFNDNASSELKDLWIQHTIADPPKRIEPGDIVSFGDNKYTVTAVCREANQTVKSLGHCTFKLNGNAETELLGEIELKTDGIPPDVKVGDVFGIKI